MERRLFDSISLISLYDLAGHILQYWGLLLVGYSRDYKVGAKGKFQALSRKQALGTLNCAPGISQDLNRQDKGLGGDQRFPISLLKCIIALKILHCPFYMGLSNSYTAFPFPSLCGCYRIVWWLALTYWVAEFPHFWLRDWPGITDFNFMFPHLVEFRVAWLWWPRDGIFEHSWEFPVAVPSEIAYQM